MKKQEVTIESVLAKIEAARIARGGKPVQYGYTKDVAEMMCETINGMVPIHFDDVTVESAECVWLAKYFDERDRESDPEYDGPQVADFINSYEPLLKLKGVEEKMLLETFEEKMNYALFSRIEKSKILPFMFTDAGKSLDMVLDYQNTVTEFNGRPVLVINGRMAFMGSSTGEPELRPRTVSFDFVWMAFDDDAQATDITERSLYGGPLVSDSKFHSGVKSFNTLFETKASDIKYWATLLTSEVLADIGKKMMPFFARIMNTVFDYRAEQVNPGGASITQLYLKGGNTTVIWATVNHLFNEKGIDSATGKVVEMPLSDAISILNISSALLPTEKSEFAKFIFLFKSSEDQIGGEIVDYTAA